MSEGGFQSVFESSISDMKNNVWSLDKLSLKKHVTNISNPFWVEVFKAWINYKKEDGQVLKIPIWNSFLMNKNILYRKDKFVKKGIIYINDIVSVNGGFLLHKDFMKQYGVKINFLDYHSIIHSMPVSWRKEVQKTKKLENVVNEVLQTTLGKEKVCKYVYDEIIKTRTGMNKKAEKWSCKLEKEVSEEVLTNAFVTLRKATTCSVLRSFQYMIIHRAIVTNDYLFKCKIKDTDKCYFCGDDVETLEHLFCDCILIKQLWNELANKVQPFVDIHRFLVKENTLKTYC